MINIVVGGQMEKQAIAKKIEELGGDRIAVTVKSDMEGALALKNNEADYYIGACHTGGGAIAMPIAMVGRKLCATVSSPGKPPKEEDIAEHVRSGVKAFGFAVDHIDEVVSAIVRQLLAAAKG